MLLAGEVEQAPGTPGEDDAVDVDVVLDEVLKVVVRLVERTSRPARRRSARPPPYLAAGASRALRRRTRRRRAAPDRPGAAPRGVAAHLLNVVGIAVEHLQDRQGPLRLGQLARHLVGRHQSHERVVAVVILAAEGAGVGQRGGGHQPAEVLAGLDPLDDGRKQPVDRGLLHQGHQRLHRPERQTARRVVRQGGRSQPQVLGQDRAHAGDQHAPAHVREKLTTVTAIHGRSLLGLVEKSRGGHYKPPWKNSSTECNDRQG